LFFPGPPVSPWLQPPPRYDMTFNTASANLARNMLDGNRQNLTSPADGVWGAGGTNNVG
jgi:hypothetical protein